MQDESTFAALPEAIWRDLHNPEVLWQIVALALCLGAAWLLQRLVLSRAAAATAEGRARGFGQRGLRRVLFPLTALILVVAARAVVGKYHPVHLLNLAVPLLLSLALVRFVAFAVRQAVGPSSWWLAGFERLFSAGVWGVVALHIVGWLPEVIDGLSAVSFTLGTQRLSLWVLLQGAAMVLFTLLVAMWIAGAVERRLTGAVGIDESVRLVLVRVTKAALILVAVLVALPMVGIDLTTLSVFGGALGVGLGFGLQKIAANYVSGFIILLDRSLRIGNLIAVGEARGVVKQITTRYTVVRAANGVESIIPNETLVGSVVQNETFSDTRVALPINFQVAYGTDLERAMAILAEVAAGHPRVLDEPAPKAFLVNFGESGIDLRVGCWIADPQEGTLGIVSDVNLEVWRRFRAEGIEIPFPQREVRLLPPLPEAVPGAVAIERSLAD